MKIPGCEKVLFTYANGTEELYDHQSDRWEW